MRESIRELELDLPLTPKATRRLEIGDVVYLNGVLYTSREGVYDLLFEKGESPPVDVAALSNVTFHCAPAVSETDDGGFRITSVTATASFRFAKYMSEFVPRFGVRAVIGKTGMPPETYRTVFRRHGTVYLNTVGYGLGAIYGAGIAGVRRVVWKERLGLAQAMWFLEVRKFGPLIVESDTRGRSMFEQENRVINPRLLALYEGLGEPILKRLGEKTRPDCEMV
jgi:L(+)-tartrate dehydratase beta subunit